MDRMQYIMDRLPKFYDKDNKSRISAIASAISDELSITDKNIDLIDSMRSIYTTNGIELDTRWGKLLNMPRIIDESDQSYRNRLALSYQTLAGGTEDALKYAAAVLVGINNNKIETDKRIKVIDAWEYNGRIPVDTSYGNVVVTIDLSDLSVPMSELDLYEKIEDVIKIVKASGVKVFFDIISSSDIDVNLSMIISTAQSMLPMCGSFDCGMEVLYT